jgi:peptide/nickel transport system substrate-binding protein
MHRRILGLLASAAIALGACTPAATSGPQETGAAPSEVTVTAPPVETLELFNPAYKPGEAKTGGQIIFGDWQEANQFNPYYVGQVTEANVASAVWAGLVVFTDDYKFAPDLAVDIPTTANGGVKVPGDGSDAMTVTWKLRDGLKWSDGVDLTCDDFKYAWEWVLDKDNTGLASGTGGWEDITAIDCPDATTIVLHFAKIYEGYYDLYYSQQPPLPRHYMSKFAVKDVVQGAGFRADEVKNLPVSGPFKFDTVTAGAELRLVRNDNYKGWASGKAANLDTLIFKWYGDADAMIAGFAAGEVDIATDMNDADIPKLNEQGLTAQTRAIPALTYEYLSFNWGTNPYDGEKWGCSRDASVQDRGTGCPTSDPEFRRAISYAIDKNEINSRLLGGNAQIANTLVSPQAWFYADQPPVSYDPAKANDILDKAGWAKGADGVRAKNGLKAKIELCTTTRQVRQDTLALVANWLKDVGIETVVHAASAADVFAVFNEGTGTTPCNIYRSNYDLAEFASSSSVDPLVFYTSYHSNSFEPNGGNFAQVKNADIDAAFDTVKSSVDFVKVKDAMATFQKLYAEQTTEIPLYYRKQVDLVSDKVGNFFSNPTQAGPTWNAVDWFVKG